MNRTTTYTLEAFMTGAGLTRGVDVDFLVVGEEVPAIMQAFKDGPLAGIGVTASLELYRATAARRYADKAVELPGDGFALQPGDQRLFAGRNGAREQQQSLLRSDKIRDYVLTGRDPPVGWIWRRLQRPRSTRPPAARAR